MSLVSSKVVASFGRIGGGLDSDAGLEPTPWTGEFDVEGFDRGDAGSMRAWRVAASRAALAVECTQVMG